MIELSEKEFANLKRSYEFAMKIKKLQEPLDKYQISHLRKLIKKHIKDGYTNYLRLVSVYSIDRDKNLSIYVNSLYESLLNLDNEN